MFHIKTFGCQMNVYDSEKISGILCSLGLRQSKDGELSDIYIVNTCAVREKSEEKLFSYLGRLNEIKKKKDTIIGVAGCVAQVEKDKIFKRAPSVDFIIGPDSYKDLSSIIKDAIKKREKIISTKRHKIFQELDNILPLRKNNFSAYVTVMEGCNKFCSFCIVPFARGREKCRKFNVLLSEVNNLSKNGFREITFLGQNIDSYRDPETNLSLKDLLAEANNIQEIEWIRFITSHPKDITEEFISSLSRLEKITKYIHLPVQAGSNQVLEKMKRGYTREEFIRKIEMIREIIPDVSIGTDVIVGFPGESDDDFSKTLELLEKIKFDNLFSFKYSPRPGTAAYKMKYDVPNSEKIKRLMEVQNKQNEIQLQKNRQFLGKIVKAFVTGLSKKDPHVFSGRDEGNRVINLKANGNVLGKFIRVKIESVGPHSLNGYLEEIID
ncbi:MAG: tRNA (N6-isopentenyl adenosine(37)-C2)-methylthiotransferase MiaB [Acidobacteriota bacterium]